MSRTEPTDAEITDYIDGRLDGERRTAVERWLAEHPERAREVERQRQLNEALKDLGADILDEPVPERLQEVLRRPKCAPRGSVAGEGDAEEDAPRSAPHVSSGGPVGAIALVLIGMAAGWVTRSALEPRDPTLDFRLAETSSAFSNRDGARALQCPPDLQGAGVEVRPLPRGSGGGDPPWSVGREASGGSTKRALGASAGARPVLVVRRARVPGRTGTG